jgi:hypothetical protein
MINQIQNPNDILFVNNKITVSELKSIAEKRFGDLIKVVVDIESGVMAIGGELHADEEAFLLVRGSRQENLWGMNLYPDKPLEEMIEFDSIINIRPSQNNRSRGVESEEIRNKIIEIVKRLVV